METKKTPRADLESKKGLFIEIGLTVVLAIMLLAFNWKSYDQEEMVQTTREAVEVIEDVVIQTAEETPPPPPEEQPIESTDLVVVDDDKELENEYKVKDASDDGSRASETYVIPVATAKVEEEVEETEIFKIVESMPTFPGGEEKMMEYLRDNIKYPQAAKETGITGRVLVSFVVERDGSITNAKVDRDIGGGCGAEALKVIKSMPKWEPGKQRGKSVRVEVRMPVAFNLR